MNGKALTVTIGADTSTTQVAQAIKDAWNASSRLDSENGATDATSNFGGQEFGEFAEVEASIDPDAASVVVLTARKAGVPFTVAATEATAGSGTATGASAQAATGPWHWNNGANWSGGSVPANDDILEFRDQSGDNVGFKYGLPNGSLEVTIRHWMSYTGQIGLPPINRDNGSKPYNEYRQRFVRLDDAGTGTNIAHRFGLGKDGTGSPLINLKHSTLKCSPKVFNTGVSQIQGVKALNICATANTSTLHILGQQSSVEWGTQDGSTSEWASVTQSAGDSRGITGITSAGTITLQGGTMLLGGASDTGQILVRGGTLRIEDQTTTITQLDIREPGIVEYVSTALIDGVSMSGGTFDASVDAGPFTITDVVWSLPKPKWRDPSKRITHTNPIQATFNPSDDMQFGLGDSDILYITTSPP